MATQQEDFSFPTTTDTPPRFIESPRLWRTTSLVSPSHPRSRGENGEEEDHLGFCYRAPKRKLSSVHQRKSFSHIEGIGIRKRSSGGDYNDEDYGKCASDHEGGCTEEKMDMLWEDFNEEFSRNSKSSSAASSTSPKRDIASDDNFHHNPNHHHQMSHGKMLNFGCVHTLKLSKPNKRPSIVVFMKVLKKMLMLQNSHRTVQKSQ